jgi:gluconate 2-dehydrogenase gamma chain
MKLNRREALGLVTSVPLAALTITPEEASAAAAQVAQAKPYVLRFFTTREYATVVALSDLILPRDARSASASEAGAPEFIDFIVAEQPSRHTAMRGGLVWLDTECRRRFDKSFLDCTDAERRQVADDIAYPGTARPEMRHGVAFFTAMRDLVATGFWSSRVGVEDLGYLGNRPVGEFPGAPPDVLKRLGVSYD